MFSVNTTIRIIGAIIFTAVLYASVWAIYNAGGNKVRVEMDAEMNRAKAAFDKAERGRVEEAFVLRQKAADEIAELHKQHDQLSRKVSNDYAQRLDKIAAATASANSRLRLPATVCPVSNIPTMPATPSATTGANATDPGTFLLPEPVERNLRRLIAECERAAAVAQGLQDFEHAQQNLAIPPDTIQ